MSGDKCTWIGLHKMTDEGTFTWIDQEVEAEEEDIRWEDSEANDYGSGDCVLLRTAGHPMNTANNQNCNFKNCYALCEKPFGVNSIILT